jgi:hypothetical protein
MFYCPLFEADRIASKDKERSRRMYEGRKAKAERDPQCSVVRLLISSPVFRARKYERTLFFMN